MPTKDALGFATKDFVKTTIVGGVLFLLPVLIVLFVLGQAVAFATGVIQPFLTTRQLTILGGAGLVVLTILALVLLAFLAGVLARTETGGRFTVWLESTVLGAVPQYRVVKGIAQGFVNVENTSGVKPSLISTGGGWRLGYLIGTLENGWVTVFLPLSPRGTTGDVMYFPADRVRPLDITMGQAMGIVSSVGVGSKDALRGVDLTAPAAT